MTIAVYLNLGIVEPLPIDARRDWVADAQTLGTRLVVLIGFAGGYILFPYGLPLFLCAVFIAGLVVLLLTPKLLR